MNFDIRFIVCSLLLCGQSTYTLDIVVTSENNSGVGTLRQAIEDLNTSGGGTAPNTITFTNSVKTINLTSPLPSIDNPVTIDGFGVIAVDCDMLSPVDNPEQFSAAITVTIDGIQIPTTGSTSIVGLTICADNVTVRGLRIANFNNIDDAQVAGIATDGNNTLIECCEVTNLNGNKSNTFATIIGIQGKNDTIISKCFVHILNSLNREATNSTTETGAIIGITLFKTARACRIVSLKSGGIIYTTPGSTTSLILKSGFIFGITDIQALNVPCRTRQCECPTNCEGSECLLIENCIVNCCQSGSISATESAQVTISSAWGIIIGQAIKSVIHDCTVCNIQTGNATLLDGTFTLILRSTFGINISSGSNELCNNNIHVIHRGTVNLGGLNSVAFLSFSAGINSNISTLVAENNTISNVSCQKVTASGTCTTINDQGSSIPIPICENNLANPFLSAPPICTGMFFDSEEIQLCNNTVTNISAGKRFATGEHALITAGYTAGIWANALQEITAEDNTVQDIFGAELVAGPAARGIFGGIGSKGIALWSVGFDGADFTITAERNTVERVCEQTLRTATGVPGEYIFLEELSGLTEILKPSAQTIGISIKTDQDLISSSKKITVNNNTIKDIAGAIVNGDTPGVGTMAIGISVNPPAKINVRNRLKTHQELCTLFQVNGEEPSEIRNNNISNIWGGTKNAAYGILLDSTNSALQLINDNNELLPLLFDIKNNRISNVTGLGTPQTFEAPLISLEECGTIDQALITFIPFPYQPTSGIYTLFGNCVTIDSNTITTVTEPSKNARGITTQASSDVDITGNTISKINGYGIFVGGATADIDFINENGLFTEAKFETFFASTRNKIFSNSTFDNSKQGIELGLIDWNDYFEVSESQCGSRELFLKGGLVEPEEISIVGNHGQPAPRICNVRTNRNGTITINFIFDSPDQPFTKFIIQFFASKTNSVPHGEQHISDFNDPICVFKTDLNGRAKASITFTPVVLANNNDIFSAHVTVATAGQSTTTPSKNKGDTSEFGLESDINACPTVVTARPSTNNQKPGWLSFLGK